MSSILCVAVQAQRLRHELDRQEAVIRSKDERIAQLEALYHNSQREKAELQVDYTPPHSCL